MQNSPYSSKSQLVRRQFLKKMTCGLAGSVVLGSQLFLCNKKRPTPTRPNIVIMVADDAGWHDVGYHGSEIKTPNIDQLLKAGVELNQFYVYPTCSPTRASLLTGRPPSRFGILGPIGGRSKLSLPKETDTLASMLSKNGYRTAITGKWHLGLRPEVGPRSYGFDYTYGYLHGQIDQYTHFYKNGDKSWHRNDKFITEEGHATDLITKEAIRFIEESTTHDKPFFLYVPFSVPHYPLQEEKKWTSLYDNDIENESRQLFAASVTHMDDAIGKIMSTLKKEKLDNETLVLFMSDNGGQENWYPDQEYNKQHGPNDRLGDNKPLRDWKGSLYEGGIRVPAVMAWKSILQPGKVQDVISVYDVLPTLAHVSGSTITSDMQVEGENIWFLLTANTKIKDRTLYWRTSGQLALRKGDWKLVHLGVTPEQGKSELYNIANDPLEKKDVAKDYSDILTKLQSELVQHYKKDKKMS